tara:strand:- start:719 stop:1549 length:831 start_codon:yes stop_codon:yes gene_type:complete
MRVGIIISGGAIKNYETNELLNLINSHHQITYIFSENIKEKKKNKYFNILKSVFTNKLFYLIFLEQKIAQLLKNNYSYLVKLKELEKKVNIFDKFEILKSKNIHYFDSKKINNLRFGFDEDTLLKIKNYCDILILFGYNKIIHKNYLNITKYGILSFHTSDINKYRGRPAGFYEFINNDLFGGLTLQILDEEIDNGKIVELRSTDIQNSKSYDETLFKMMSLKEDLIVKGLDKIEKGHNLSKSKKFTNLSINNNSRRFSNVFKCLKKTIINRYFTK